MRYPCVITQGEGSYGLIFPDLPGCYPSGGTIDDAFDDAREAVACWMECQLDEGFEIAPPSSLEAIEANPEYKGLMIGLVDIDMGRISDKAERVNITLPKRILRRLDELANKAGDSRSGYIARMVLAAS